MARKKKAGVARTKRGRVSRARANVWDYGNDKITQLEAQFAPFESGKAGQWVKTPIGRAWAVGLLDGHDIDPAALRDAGLGYAERYWGYWPAPAAVANYEGQDRRGGSWGDSEDRRGKLFRALDEAVVASGRAARNALHELVVDSHWFPLDDPPWLGRLINERMLRRHRPVSGELPRVGDAQMLKLAMRGLLAIAGGAERKRAA